MLKKGLFKQPKNELEKGGRMPKKPVSEQGTELTSQCPACNLKTPVTMLLDNFNVCNCGYHFQFNARQRIDFIADEGSFCEMFDNLESVDIISFPGYEGKLKNAKLASKEREAVVCGTAEIGKNKCALFVMESGFMMGSMGSVVGEKVTRMFEYATEHNLPVVGYTVSGGARMQEGIISLMQMAKTSGAVKRHSDACGFYLAVLTHPTTGGVTASFASEGDIILAEPQALIGFAGPRVIEQTIRKKLPPEFQTAEFLLDKGFIDNIAPRKDQKQLISKLLSMHKRSW
ncbi:MAG: acetyl-CoA carboxylase, carboxyltransferase subunit beta [Eubacteriaceae bacterium]